MQNATSRALGESRTSPNLHASLDVDVAGLWASSGAQWLTAAGVGVPAGLVRRVVQLTSDLDAAGACIAGSLGSRGLGILGERAAAVGLPPSGTSSAGGSCRLFDTAVGAVAVSLARPSDLELVPAWLESAVVTGIAADVEPMWAAIADVLLSASGRRVTALVERAGWLGLPVALAGETVRGADPLRVERLGSANARPLKGAVVVNLGSLWAGPLAGAVLAELGARVIKVESSVRPDGARHHRSFFASLHHSCESVALDLAGSHGHAQLGQLLKRADIVIEGSRPRALEQMGIDARQIARDGPQVWVSITGHGRDAANEHRVSFGDDAAVAGGLVGRTSLRSDAVFIADAVADPITGLTTAHAVAEYLAVGGRWLVDVALANVAASVAGEWVPALSMDTAARPQRRSVDAAAWRPLPLGRDTHSVVKEFELDQ